MRISTAALSVFAVIGLACGSSGDAQTSASASSSAGAGGHGSSSGAGGMSVSVGAGGAGGACIGGGEIVGEGEPLASLGACDKLVYRTYASRGSDASVHRLPDFSWAGYEGGGVAIPDVPVVKTVSPINGDDGANIQKAIDAVAAMPLGADGFRGAVLITKGAYQAAAPIVINADGIVLRGEGQGADGTVITATAAMQYDLISVEGSGSGYKEIAGSKTAITDALVPVGSRSFAVKSAAPLAVGDRIVVLRTPNQAWIDALKMGTYGWTPGGYAIEHERTITAIAGDTVTVDIPIVDAIEEAYGGGAVYKADVPGRIRHVGVEDLRLDSDYQSATDEQHGWTAVHFSRVTDAWARRLTAAHFGYSAVAVDNESRYITVEDAAHLDPISQITGGRRYPFYVGGGQGVLFQRCFTRNGRHSFVSGARVTGPNVWVDCLAIDTHADDGPHHRWATGLLFDNTSGGELRVQNRKDSGTGHGWSGAQTLFWNAKAGTLVCDAPLAAMNWSIGSEGMFVEGQWAPEEPQGHVESHGSPVEPRSLYLQQLRDRLGSAAVDAITMPAQRKGRIWAELATWAGEGRLDTLLQ